MQSQLSFEKRDTGTLFLVPTPIGNLGDMTYRSVATLKNVALIAAEDTRNTQKLLNHFEIETPQISFHEHNTQERIPQLIAKLQAGEDIAQVSDAGMPSISDPGQELVKACVAAGLTVVPLPGANAGLTALIASGITPQPFYFYGFLDRKPKLQRDELTALVNRPETLIFYEAPHRLAKTLTNIASELGEQRPAALCRELTKKHEEFIRGSLAELVTWATTDQVRGEFVIIVSGNPNPEIETPADDFSQLTIEEHVDQLIDSGLRPNDAIKQVAHLRQLKKQDVYQIYHHIEKK
ncbi:16S rRNA (cytidine(1402)-2'-O)-methyltransferase [Secundilactobacillus paracollinoides]|uniref:Ribosomal RNA small subunit methyltransferase I n=1 Tax=Secundilactobacillus paracollinoides TaxID=240427 RepID=A0A1B2IZJ3_9LACO|nr:16S rRNA (cytidine(1402)-2'-O)-methyltransferase [Secundilactobacillus paracollinoides]ANZ61555.1 rRNA (cytidine-2'-O-)-methyltransferase [Secundilactobacillus paracollinoides]ANZ67475.1 rRNA (cytidine-2'-O-)-methyltransferase [Secundilactobacillus paracollinoides]KRL76892.1 methyltransferase [Secundilactobacillus paracollinoides DSM 15502 = JCM 11969]